LVAQRAQEYPVELSSFLESVGVDPFKEAEVWEAGPLQDGYTFNAGWWHFIGTVVSAGESVIHLNASPLGRAKDWQFLFLPGQASLKLASLPGSPLIQAEFTVTLPWVLDEPYPAK
jgi:hypothetical protein